jgi:CelD/BcsL family acetyltransferase involved in cellulose biosynthesis
MIVQRISSSEELAQLADQWNCIAHSVPFRSWEWLYSWWRHYGDGRELSLLTVRDAGGQLVGSAPLYLDQSIARGRVLRFLGSGEVCSDYLTVMSTPEHEDGVAAAVAQWLIRASTGAMRDECRNCRWDLLELTGIDAEDGAAAKLAKHFEAEGYPVHRRNGLACWRIDLPQTWEEYLAGLSKSQRKQVRQLDRRMFDAGRASLRIVRSAEQLERGMQILEDLHQRRWRRCGQPGCFASRRFSGFLREAAERLLRTDQLLLMWVELGGRPAAAAIHFTGGDVMHAYQAGMDPDASDESPGALTHIAAIKLALEQRCRAFDFLRGDEPYKAQWRARPRPSVELRVAAKRAFAKIRHSGWRAGGAVKRWIKTGLTRRPAANTAGNGQQENVR